MLDFGKKPISGNEIYNAKMVLGTARLFYHPLKRSHMAVTTPFSTT